jgi:hypothetical protein
VQSLAPVDCSNLPAAGLLNFLAPVVSLGAVAPTRRLSLAANMTAAPVAGSGVALLYAAIILLVLTWVTFVLRIWVRVARKTWGSDDYLMLIGLVWSPTQQSDKAC